MKDEEKLWDIRERTFVYALSAVKLFRTLQESEDRADMDTK